MQGLQQQLDKRNEDHDRIMILMNALQHGTDDMATLLLARLRIGESLDKLVTSIQAGEHLPVLDQQYQTPVTIQPSSSQHGLWPDLDPQDRDIQSETTPIDKGSPSTE